ncbi:MAG: TonB-dependent receptor [Bacteroidales bacterium]|nr:TonB-dependent receptor [Bacteroidales bacterium]
MKKVILFVLFALCSTMMLAQTITVKGTVIGAEDGMPVIGAYVLQQGTNNGTSTDVDGNYSIEVPKDATLVFSSIGFTTQAVAVNGRAELNVLLKADAVQLEETIIVAYGTAKKGTYTGAASVLKKEAIADVPTTSFENALNGKIAGLQINQTSGQAGSTSQIRIRGIGSMNASNEPLYVIDGVPANSGDAGQMSDYVYSTNNIMNTLNPSDIESITVLKDAAASSLYGSRAANGVILITTKKGKVGKPTVTLKASVAFSPDWASDQWVPAGAQENAEMLYEIHYDRRTSQGEATATAFGLSQLNSRFGVHGYEFSAEGLGRYAKINIKGKTDGVEDRTGKYFDWADAYFRTSVYQTYDLSVSGGTENTSYYSSFAYTKDQGRTITNDFDRLTGRVNVTQKVGKLVELATSVNVAHTDQRGFNDTQNNNTNYYMQYINFNHGFYWPTDYKTGEPFTARYGSLGRNLVYYQNEWDNSSKNFKVSANETLTVHLMEGLDLRSVFSYDYSETKDHVYYSPLHWTGSSDNGVVHEMSTNSTTLVTSTTLNYNTTIKDKHTITALVGFEAEDKDTRFMRATGKNLPSSSLHTVVTAGTLDAGGYSWGNSMASILSRVEYNYDGKYYISGSYRRDGSSRLSEDARWGDFWSVAGSWKINNEEWMKEYDWISNLRVRASYGINGTLPSSNYGWRSLAGYSYQYQGNPGGALTNIANANLSWETSYTTNVALEFGFWDQRLYGTVEYFNRDSKDLLQDVPISTITGFSSTLQNIGEINNKGFEIEIGGDIIRNEELTWDASITASMIKSEVTKLYGGQDIIWSDPTGGDGRTSFIYREGESVLSYYGYEWAGVDPQTGLNMVYVNGTEQEEAELLSDGTAFLYNGRAVVEGDSGNDFQSYANRVILASATPKLYGGINTSVTWKGINLGLNFTYRLGSKIYDAIAHDVDDDGWAYERVRSQHTYDNRWKTPGQITHQPLLIGTDAEAGRKTSSRRIHNGDYLRLKNITLGYTIPKDLVKKVGLSNARVYFNGQNLLTLRSYELMDPEVNAYGTRGWEVPLAKTYTFGIELSF